MTLANTNEKTPSTECMGFRESVSLPADDCEQQKTRGHNNLTAAQKLEAAFKVVPANEQWNHPGAWSKPKVLTPWERMLVRSSNDHEYISIAHRRERGYSPKGPIDQKEQI